MAVINCASIKIFSVALLIGITTQNNALGYEGSSEDLYSGSGHGDSSGDNEVLREHLYCGSGHGDYSGDDEDSVKGLASGCADFSGVNEVSKEDVYFESGHDRSLEESKEQLAKIERELTTSSKSGQEIVSITARVQKIVEGGLVNSSNRQELVDTALRVPLRLLTDETTWENIILGNGRSQIGYELLLSIEKIIFTLNSTHLEGNESFHFTPEDSAAPAFTASFGIVKSSNHGIEVIHPRIPASQDSFIKVRGDWKTLEGATSYVGVSIDSKYIEKIMPPSLNRIQENKDEKTLKIINSKVISMSVQGLPSAGNVHGGNIMTLVTFHHELNAYGDIIQNIRRRLHPGEHPRAVRGSTACVYWSQKENLWLTNGCMVNKTTLRTTLCVCDHLTSFTVLMDVHNYVGKDPALEILTLILCPLSAVCLIIVIILLSTLKTIQNQRTTITINLCACLLIGIILILFVTDRNYLYLSNGACVAAGIFTHYVYLAAFAWMAMEGVCLYKMIIQVFESHRSPTKLYMMLGYGVPALLVGITCAIGFGLEDEPYGNDLYCWLNGNYQWGFAGPALVITLGNLIVLCLVLKTVQRKGPQAHSSPTKSNKKLIQGSFSITVLLGITWLPGFFVFTDSAELATISAYVFVLFNASQGIFLFVFNCVLNEKVGRLVRESRVGMQWSPSSVAQETEMTPSVYRTTTKT